MDRRRYLKTTIGSLFWPIDPEHERAINELADGQGVCALDDLESIVERVHQRVYGRVHAKLVKPETFCCLAGFPCVWDPSAPRRAQTMGGVIVYRGHKDRRIQAGDLYHELAENLAPDEANHTDIQALTSMLPWPRTVARPLLKQYGYERASRKLLHLNRFAPPYSARMRLLILIAGEHEAEVA